MVHLKVAEPFLKGFVDGLYLAPYVVDAGMAVSIIAEIVIDLPEDTHVTSANLFIGFVKHLMVTEHLE